jgi:hypothetical protein
MESNSTNNKIELTGKVAKFPKNTKAVTALQYLEKIKVNQNKVWYVIVENQDNELKMVKYNRAKGVNLLDYCAELKAYYRIKYKNDPILEQIETIEVIGENDFSVVKNIPDVTLESGITLLSKITSDLIKLLAD